MRRGSRISKGTVAATVIVIALMFTAAAVIIYANPFAPARVSPDEFTYFVPSEPFVTNVRDSERMLMSVIAVEMNSGEQGDTLRELVIRDTILFILRELDEEAIRSTDIKEVLRIIIVGALNERLDDESVVDIYITDFVMQ